MKRFYYLGGGVIGLIILGLFSYLILVHPKPTSYSKKSYRTISQPKTSSPSSTLAIAAIKAHPTPGGTITTAQQLAPRNGCATSIISYPSDGFTVYALLQIPSSAKPANGYPVIIVDHGYYPPLAWNTDTTNAYSDADYMNALCAAGFVALRPDYRGNANSQGTAHGGDIYADYVYDDLNLIHSLKSLPQANANAVGIEGHSMGGAVTLKTLVVDSSIKASVIVAGVTTTMQNIVYNWAPDPIPSDIQAQVSDAVQLLGGTPEQDPTAWHDASAINYAKNITGPVQIDAGTADETVPYAWSQDFDTALTQAGVKHTLISYPGANHIFTKSADRSELIANMVAFFKANVSSN